MKEVCRERDNLFEQQNDLKERHYISAVLCYSFLLQYLMAKDKELYEAREKIKRLS